MEITLLEFVIIFVSLLLIFLHISKNSSKNLPPGPRKFPIIGSLHAFAGSQNPPHHTMRDLSEKYGPVMHLQLGENSFLVISSPESAKQVMKTHDIKFASRASLVVSKILGYADLSISFAPYGEYWRQMRKICSDELLSLKRVQSLQPIRREEISNLCKYIASKAESPICLREMLKDTCYNVIMRSMFGKNNTRNHSDFIMFYSEIIKIAAGLHISEVFPSIKFLPLVTGYKTKIQNLHSKSNMILDNIIQQHKLNVSSTSADIDTGDECLLDVLLKQQDPSFESPLTTNGIKAVLLDLIAGGVETVSTTVDWAMTELLRTPKVMKKVQDEVRLVFDGKPGICEKDFDELKYLKLVIKETLRLHPSVPLLLPRESKESCVIDGYDIPAKTRVLVNAWGMGRDPKYWGEDVNIFKPERFLEISADYSGNNYQFIPFGSGRRMCPGSSFGLANIELPLAMFLYHFDWILPQGMTPDDIDISETFGASTSRKIDLYVTPIVKKPLAI